MRGRLAVTQEVAGSIPVAPAKLIRSRPLQLSPRMDFPQEVIFKKIEVVPR